MNCIIVDDIASSKQLEEFVSKCSFLYLVGIFNDSFSAVDQLTKKHNIDLAFIDVKSIGAENFDMISNLQYAPSIIVVSSTGYFASKAFGYDVVDYLIKPVNYSKFSRAVDRTLRLKMSIAALSNDDKEIFIRKDSSLVKLKMKHIIYAEALENYVTLVTTDKKYTILYTLKGIDQQLPSEIFVRVHRSYVVNKRMIRKIYENSLELIVGDTLKNIPLGKAYKSSLLGDINVMDRKNFFIRNQINPGNSLLNLNDKPVLYPGERA